MGRAMRSNTLESVTFREDFEHGEPRGPRLAQHPPDLVERAPAPRARRALELQRAHVARCDTAVVFFGVDARAGNEHGLVAARAASVHFLLVRG